uniref:Uncharacterized protein n=1 Tax=Pseudo-nitzschia australis TaxID=44445 RepID=A0A7S4AYH4_9STRA|mmetsp:Transcript_19965/g.42191  ORF Transcript_19965/g.42191 Transcript_19965/m.42191 type:complete len:404 (-) Transcript_19965:1007-2218(-)|eukprot:CAMPEP_0168297122 /NCGR_PEP_ID=MMETSP0142_2-20121227/18287_1 /TAXON_ID=44445 /ORGANISM="Pseudo-nitzschia australis, Strain 10249 10 AB" /LENGTH=403 /DNA_ID=CAMNT_0008246249 /DNA_START=76 /DNA_END=1287 /DNA_ORIENTATION=-
MSKGYSQTQPSTASRWHVKMFISKLIVFALITSSIHALKHPSVKTQRSPSTAAPSNDNELSRRQLIFSGATAASAGAVLLHSNPANAARAKGAAELDLEFYLRDLVNGNKKEGSILPSNNGPPVPPPRTLKGSILPLLLNKECSADCIPVQALIEEIEKQDKAAGRTSTSKDAIVKDIQSRVDAIREKTKRSFLTKAPWNEEDISDQYYFDFTIYALWKTAAELIENNPNRDRFLRNIGRMLVSKLEIEGILTQSSSPQQQKLSKDNGVLVSSIPVIMELLNIFKTSGYCKNYRIRSSDSADAVSDDLPVFDELDDESLSMVGTTNCLVSIYEPAVLGASLQINGENSRFAPDFIGPSLAAIWERNGGIRSTWDVFFVDPVYRPNPKDYFPNEQLLQITLNKR